MRKHTISHVFHSSFRAVQHHPFDSWRHDIPMDMDNPYFRYWLSISVTALLVALYQFFSILPARQALIRIASAVPTVYAGGFVFLYALIFATQGLLTFFRETEHLDRLPMVFLSAGPWIAAIAFVACITSIYWPCDILAILTIIMLGVRMTTILNIGPIQAARVLIMALTPMLAIILYWSWAKGWNLFPFW
jgi:hypothetical protein